MQTCPKCQNSVRDRETRCDRCGTRMDGSAERPVSIHPLNLIGALLLVAGLIGSIHFLAMFDVGVKGDGENRVVNAGLVSDRSTGITFTAGLMVAGAALLGRNR
jgi:hypothetical protein